MDKINQNLG